jgi:hypothetical protein
VENVWSYLLLAVGIAIGASLRRLGKKVDNVEGMRRYVAENPLPLDGLSEEQRTKLMQWFSGLRARLGLDHYQPPDQS